MQLIFLALSVPRVMPEKDTPPKRAALQNQVSVCDSGFLLLSSLVLPSGRGEVDNSS